jgi:SulP family sulfate permease
VHSQPREVVEKAGFLDRIGRENVCPHIAAALERARRLIEPSIVPGSGV